MITALRITKHNLAKTHKMILIYLTESQPLTQGPLGGGAICAMFTEVWACLAWSPLSPVGWWKFRSGSPGWVKVAPCCLRLTRIWGSTPATSLLPVRLYHLPLLLLLRSQPRQNKSRRQPQVAGHDSCSWENAERCCAAVAIIQAGPGWCSTN